MRTIQLAIACLAVATTTACDTRECGEGAFKDGNQCVGFDPNDKDAPVTTVTPGGGRTRSPLPDKITLVTDEPAVIYYTQDGTEPDIGVQVGETSPVTVVGVTQGMTLKFFAVDRAGNEEAVKTAVFDSDTAAPAPVTDLDVSISGTTATITWTEPSAPDFAGVVLARVRDVIDGSPVPGQMYTGPAALSPSVDIIRVGTGTQFVDMARPPGPVRYVAWSFDDLGNYSRAVAAADAVPLGALTAQLTYAVSSSTLTVTQTPASMSLVGTTAMRQGTTLTVSVVLTNNSSRYFQNPKWEVGNTVGGSFANSDGTADNLPFRTLGPEMLAPGATITRDLVFTGVSAGTTTINLALASHGSLMFMAGRNNPTGQQGMVDLGSGAPLPGLSMTIRGPNDRLGGKVRPPLLVGGRYIDVPTSHGSIERFDLVTRTRTGGVELGEGERLNAMGLFSNGSYEIALLKRGGHRRVAELELVLLDEGLKVVDRFLPGVSMDRGWARSALSADGKLLAIPTRNGIMLVDTATMRPIDAVPTTPLLDMIEPGFISANNNTMEISGVEFFNGTSGLIAVARREGQASIITRDENGYTTRLYHDNDPNARGFGVTTATDGTLWMVYDDGVRAYNPTNDQVNTVNYGTQSQGLGTVGNRTWFIRSDKMTIDEVSTTGSVSRSVNVPTGAYGHWLGTAN